MLVHYLKTLGKAILAPWLLDSSARRQQIPSLTTSVLRECPPPRLLSAQAEKGAPSVCLVIDSLHPGGAERQLVNLAILLQQRGLRVRVRALNLGGPYEHYAPFLLRHGIDLAPLPNSAARNCLLPLLRHRRSTLLFHCLPYSILIRVMHLAEELLREPADVVHAYLEPANFVAAWASLFAGVPMLRLSFRTVNPTRFWFYEPWKDKSGQQIFTPRLTCAWGFQESWMRESYQVLAAHPRVSLEANSRYAAEDYAAWLGLDPACIDVSPNGLPPTWGEGGTKEAGLALRAELGIAADIPLCLCVCRLDPEKRPLDMLAVFERIVAASPEAHCLHAGTGQMDEEVTARFHELGAAARKRIRLLGPHRDMPALYAAADLVLLCSEVESLPNTVLEAMLMGLPVVATNVGGCPELITEGITGLLRGVGDVEGLASAIINLLRDEDLRAAMGRAGREKVNEFTLDALGERTLAAYRRGLAKVQGRTREPGVPSWFNIPLNCLNNLAYLHRRAKEGAA